MSAENFTVANFYVRRHFDNGVRIGIDRQLLLARSGLTDGLLAQPLARIAPQRLADLIVAIWELGDDEFLGMTNRSVRHGTFAYLAEQLVAKKTLGDVYKETARFYRLIADGVQFSLQRHEGKARFVLQHDKSVHSNIHLLVDFLLLIWHRFPGWLIGRQIPLDYAQLAFAEPWHSAEYRYVFPCQVCFDQTCSGFAFDSLWLDAPVVQTPERLIDYLTRIPVHWFRKQSYHKLVTTQVLRMLDAQGIENDTTIESIASQMNIASRTLRRKLTTEGASFQQLKDDLRRDHAINLLANARTPVGDVGREVGFCEPAAFARAFKRWTGVSPGRYRRESCQ